MKKQMTGRFMILLLCAAAALGLFTAAAQAEGGITTWAELQAALKAGGTVTLTEKITASSGSRALTVPSGTTVTLDLNGCTIDRNMTGASADGYAIVNNGELTIMDNSADMSGVITGAFGFEEAGAIQNNNRLYFLSGNISGNCTNGYGAGVLNCAGAVFTMTGGVICDNEALNYGGGVCNRGEFRLEGGRIDNNYCRSAGGGVANYGTFVMLDGTIVNNSSQSNCGGVYLHAGTAAISGGSITGSTARDLYLEDNQESPKLNMSGSPVIGNLFLEGSSLITVTGAFTSSADITVTVTNEGRAGRFTSGYGAYHGDIHPTEYFHAKNASVGVTLSGGEGALVVGLVNFVPYVERTWDGTKVVSETKTADAAAVPSSGDMTGGWYYLNSHVTKNARIESITGDVSLILGDGCTLDVEGLYVPAGSTLTVYGQTEGTGKICSHPSGGAAIGGYSEHDNGNIVIHGGIIQADGYDNCAGIGSNDSRTGGAIAIYGGTITARGGKDGAAIGGGKYCSGGTITIYGGNITANGPTESDSSENGAGIGGGNEGSGGHITIYGGTVTAWSRDGAGIGGGDDGDGGHIAIHGGTITSTKVNQGQGARIGGGCDAAPGTIVIDGGTVTAVGGFGACIGGGRRNTAGGSVTISGGVISASGTYGIGAGEDGSGVAVILDYTDATKDTISITSGSFSSPVNVRRSFSNGTRVVYPASLEDTSLLTDGTLTACEGPVDSWSLLRALVIGAPDGAVIKLTEDLTAASDDTALTALGSKNITIDMNGKTLDRNLTSASEDGSVFIVSAGTGLTLRNGTLTGGFASRGGGIRNSGTLVMTGCTMTGSAAGGEGGGICCESGSATTLNGANSITANASAGEGGGIYAAQGAVLTVSGLLSAEGNFKGGEASNIYLAGDAVIHLDGALDEGSRLGVTKAGGVGMIADGYGADSTAAPDSVFIPDDGNSRVFQSGSDVWISVSRSVSTWEQLRLALEQGGTVLVSEDIAASESDSVLNIPQGIAAEVDLQGYLLNASALSAPADVTSCLTISGSLVLSDSAGWGGLQCGDGNTLENFVYVDSHAAFTMNGGTFGGACGKADVAVYGGSFRLNGGSLAGSGQAYGNVWVGGSDGGTAGRIAVSGSPRLSMGVCLADGHRIDVAGTLGADVTIPVLTETMPTDDAPVTITNGLARGGENAADRFISMTEACYAAPDGSGEVELRRTPREWETLQQWIDISGEDAVLTLERDYTAADADRSLNIADGKTLTIDLNGHTIDGTGLTADDVLVINGGGYLTLRDQAGGGAILGRGGSSVVACLSRSAVFCLESGTISGDGCKQTVFVYDGRFFMEGGTVDAKGTDCEYAVKVYRGFFILTGGTIHALQTYDDSAVWIETEMALLLEGSPVINGSVVVCCPIQIIGPIGQDVRITIWPVTDYLSYYYGGTFTYGLQGNGTVENFIPHDPNSMKVGLTEDGEAFVGDPVTVSFAPGYETDETMDPVEWAKNGWYPLPACGYGGPEGHVFAGWRAGEGAELKNAGDRITVTADITVTAVWEIPAFGNPDFVLPGDTAAIEEGAFEGIAASAVEIPANCRSIGDYAFRDCGQLTMIRIPAGCGLGTGVFDGCARVYVFGAAGSDAERYCSEHENCVFVADAQD